MKSSFCAAAPPTLTFVALSSVDAGPSGARRRSTSAAVSSLSGPVVGVITNSAECPSLDSTGSSTLLTPGVLVTASRNAPSSASSGARAVGRDHLDRAERAGAGGLGGEVEAVARLVARVELGERAGAPVERQGGDRDDQHHGCRGAAEEDRPAHHAGGPAVPERRPVVDRRPLWPQPAEPVADPADDAAALVRAAPEHLDQGRQQRDGRDHRDRDDQHRADRHRVHRLGVDEEEAGERDQHRHAGDDDRQAGGSHRDAERGVGIGASVYLLAVAGDDEQRVVDGDADAQHRGDVGDEDRHLELLGEEEHAGAGQDHGHEPEAQRQQRRGQRAEDGQQHDEHDREARTLGLLEVLLRHVLHARPQRLLADHVHRHGHVRGLGREAEVLAQLASGVDRLVGCAADRQGQQRDRLVARRLRGLDRFLRGGDVVDPGDLAHGVVDRGGELLRVAVAVVEDEDQRLASGPRGSPSARP